MCISVTGRRVISGHSPVDGKNALGLLFAANFK